MKQDLDGAFSMRLRGTPIIFVSRTQLEGSNSYGNIRAIHIGPICVGLTWSHYKDGHRGRKG